MRVKLNMESVRWAFNSQAWKPTRDEWLLAGRCVQPEELNRISRFVFTKDGKSAMAGRLLMRKLVHDTTDIPYETIGFQRTNKGKPFLTNALPEQFPSTFSFNVSHQGAYSVLAAEPFAKVGVDVMKVEYLGGRNVPDFFNLMRRQFTAEEWTNILNPSTELEQLAQFYRHWCLKESYVKALGIGIGFDLQRISFRVKEPELKKDSITCSTDLFVDGKDVSNLWTFEEALLDDCHCIAVALQNNEQNSEDKETIHSKNIFNRLSFQDLVSTAVPWNVVDETFWTDFSKKEESPGHLKS